MGLAVQRETFSKIRAAHSVSRLAEVPSDQDAEEFELHFANGVSLDILTSRAPGGDGAIARYLGKFGEGVQQVEFRCSNVDRATEILKEKFGVSAVYPETRPGADGTRVNFFLMPVPGGGKVLDRAVRIRSEGLTRNNSPGFDDFGPGAKDFAHSPGLSDAAARRVRRIALENFGQSTEAVRANVGS